MFEDSAFDVFRADSLNFETETGESSLEIRLAFVIAFDYGIRYFLPFPD